MHNFVFQPTERRGTALSHSPPISTASHRKERRCSLLRASSPITRYVTATTQRHCYTARHSCSTSRREEPTSQEPGARDAAPSPQEWGASHKLCSQTLRRRMFCAVTGGRHTLCAVERCTVERVERCAIPRVWSSRWGERHQSEEGLLEHCVCC